MKKQFTLIELMAVILILMVLMGLAFPMVTAARNQATKTRCLNDANNLKNAIIQFQSDFNRFPKIGATDDNVLSTQQYKDLVGILRGMDSSKDNKRKKTYLSRPRANLNENNYQYKCELVRNAKAKDAIFGVIFDINNNGISINRKTVYDVVVVFGYNKENPSLNDWDEIQEKGVCTSRIN